jgi:hypothetical protein
VLIQSHYDRHPGPPQAPWSEHLRELSAPELRRSLLIPSSRETTLTPSAKYQRRIVDPSAHLPGQSSGRLCPCCDLSRDCPGAIADERDSGVDYTELHDATERGRLTVHSGQGIHFENIDVDSERYEDAQVPWVRSGI